MKGSLVTLEELYASLGVSVVEYLYTHWHSKLFASRDVFERGMDECCTRNL